VPASSRDWLGLVKPGPDCRQTADFLPKQNALAWAQRGSLSGR
jgi:hypothetical protein